jgi:hypothetical protein
MKKSILQGFFEVLHLKKNFEKKTNAFTRNKYKFYTPNTRPAIEQPFFRDINHIWTDVCRFWNRIRISGKNEKIEFNENLKTMDW